MDYIIREIKEIEYSLLNDFLYEAIFIPEGVEAPPKSIIASPELQVYVSGFGTQRDDKALVAEVDGKVVGAVWVRIMNDYGHIDDKTPSFAISLYKEYRGLGIGTAMMRNMLALLKDCGYERASLAVQKANYAVRLYKKVGFEIVGENEEEYIMVKNLTKQIEVVAAIIQDGKKIFATQRGYGEFRGSWEFPGGKMEQGETPKQALMREIKEELDTEIEVGELFDTVEYDYPGFHLTLHCFLCTIKSGELVLKEHEAAKWLTTETLDSVDWLPADLGLLEKLRDIL